MKVIVNGETHILRAACTISELVGSLELGDAPCAVEVNRAVVRRADHASTVLGDGDEVEIVTLVGGG